jgi:hypothetical protein
MRPEEALRVGIMHSNARRCQAQHMPCIGTTQHEVRTQTQVAQENFRFKF